MLSTEAHRQRAPTLHHRAEEGESSPAQAGEEEEGEGSPMEAGGAGPGARRRPLQLAVLAARLSPEPVEWGRWPAGYSLSDHAMLTVDLGRAD